jgi:hypothetical protein
MLAQLTLALTWAGTRGFLDRWLIAEWLVAIGTLALAAATVGLIRRVAKQVEVEAEQLVAARRPFVTPLMGDDGDGYVQDLASITRAGPHVLLLNAGAGPALNVRGALYWTETAGGGSSLHPLVLAAGLQDWAKVLGEEEVVVNWANAVGYLRYHDLSGTEWQTHFRFRQDGYGNVRAETLTAGPTSEYGEPAYNAEEGWTNRPRDVDLWQV